jgi:hypothetical protein
MNEQTFHDFILSGDEFYLYLAFQFVMFLAAFTIGWISGWIWFIKIADKELAKPITKDEDWSMNND